MLARWAWWPADTGTQEGARFLLPVGDLPGRLRIDPMLWSQEPVFPGRYQIGTSIEVLVELERRIWLDVPRENLLIETAPGSPDLALLNASVSSFVSSLGIYEWWFERIVALEGLPGSAVETMTADAIAQMRSVETLNGTADPAASWWVDNLKAIGRLL